MKAAGVPVLLAAWAAPRDRSSLVWALMPRPPAWHSDDKDKVLLECIEGTEIEIFLSGLQEGSFGTKGTVTVPAGPPPPSRLVLLLPSTLAAVPVFPHAQRRLVLHLHLGRRDNFFLRPGLHPAFWPKGLHLSI